MTSPAQRFTTESQRSVEFIAYRFDRLEKIIMEANEQLKQGLVELTTEITKLGGNIETSHARTTEQLAAMQTTLDQFVAADTVEDANFEATISTLQQQLAGAVTSSGETLTTVQSLTSAVREINRSLESGV
jgi:hypothetical protein